MTSTAANAKIMITDDHPCHYHRWFPNSLLHEPLHQPFVPSPTRIVEPPSPHVWGLDREASSGRQIHETEVACYGEGYRVECAEVHRLGDIGSFASTQRSSEGLEPGFPVIRLDKKVTNPVCLAGAGVEAASFDDAGPAGPAGPAGAGFGGVADAHAVSLDSPCCLGCYRRSRRSG